MRWNSTDKKQQLASTKIKNGLSFSKRHVALPLLASTVLLTACSDSGWDGDRADETPIVTNTVGGAAVKGPLKGATAHLYRIDYSATDMKGLLLAEGSTNDSGEITGLSVGSDQLSDALYLLEVTGGSELNNTAPAVSVLRSLITSSDIGAANKIYATPLSTITTELARLSNQSNTEAELIQAISNDPSSAVSKVKETFGLGLLSNNTFDLFKSPPVLTDEAQQSSHDLRLANEVLAALIVELQQKGVNANNNDLLNALAADLSDDDIDGMQDGQPIQTFTAASIDSVEIVTTLIQPTSDLLALNVTSTQQPVSTLSTQLATEAAMISPGLSVDSGLATPDASELQEVEITTSLLLVDAGTNQSELPLSGAVSLDASASSTLSGAVTYEWSVVSYPVTILEPDPNVFFTDKNSLTSGIAQGQITDEGLYVIKLTAKVDIGDGEFITRSDTVDILTVKTAPPASALYGLALLSLVGFAGWFKRKSKK